MGRLVEGIKGSRVVVTESDDANAHDWNPNYLGDVMHIEEYRDSRWHNRTRLEPEGIDALLREIKRWGSGA